MRVGLRTRRIAAWLAIGLLGVTTTAGCSLLSESGTPQSVVFASDPEALRADLYLPMTDGTNSPAVVVVHGGSWVRRSGDMDSISRQLAKAGFVTLNISYRSASQYPYPAAVDDVRSAIAWLMQNAGRYNIDPERIGGWGYSAGGQLILRAGLEPSAGLKAIVSGGTPARFSHWPESPVITRFIGATYAEAPDVWEDASPVNHVESGSPPVFLYHGADDELVDAVQMDFMAQALRAKKIPVQTRLLADKGHVSAYLFAGETERQAIDFLKHWLL
ncbi:MAG: alpha/beta hydrolase [Chromatiaceae bacterium]|jgi:acetyl esterase/lipase